MRSPALSPAESPEGAAPATGRALSHRRLAAGAGAKLVTEALARVASFGVVILAARQLGPAEFGIYLYGLGLGFVLAQGADFGLQLLIAREVATRGRAAAPLVRMALKLKLGLSAAIVLLFVPFTAGHPLLVRVALTALGTAMLLQTFIEFTGYVFRGNRELEREVRLLTSTRLLAAAACALVLWLDGRLLPVTLVTLAAILFGSILSGWMLHREGWLRSEGPTRDEGPALDPLRLGALVRGALPLGVAMVLSVLYLRVGWVLLYHLTGQEAVAQLGAAQRLMEAAQLVPAAALAAVFPVYARALRTDAGGARRLGLSSAGVLVVLGGLAAGAIWWTAEWAVPTLFGPDYGPAVPVLRVLALAVPLMFVNYLFTHLIIARGSQGLVAWFGAAALACHFLVSWYLIPSWGPAGVAASMVLAESVLLLCCVAALVGGLRGPAEAAGPAPPRYLPSDAGRMAGVAILALLAALLPFEVAVWERAGFLTVTTLELLGGATVTAALITLGASGGTRLLRGVPVGGAALLAAFLVWLLVSSAFAPELSGNALRASARTALGIAVAGSAVVLVRTRRHLHLVAGAAVGGGLAAAAMGLWELVHGNALPWLGAFREQATTAGAFRRLTASFDHANQASMYMEATAPLLVALVATAWVAGRRRLAAVGALVLALYLQAAILTYSRAGAVTLVATSLAMALLVWRGRGRSAALPWATMAGLVTLLLLVTASVDSATRMRFQHGSPEQWYRVELRAPPELTLAAGGIEEVPVELVNRGAFVWQPAGEHEVRLAARWIMGAGGAHGELGRWSLPHPVAPGERVRLDIPLPAPSPSGEYEVEWDLVHEDITWFAPTTGHRFRTRVLVTAGARDPSLPTTPLSVGEVAAADRAPFLPGRGTLWRVAATELAERPLTGVGLDNFRLRYGRRLGWTEWNETIHSNSLYVETLVSAGIVGGAIFLGWLALLTGDLLRVLGSGRAGLLAVGVGAGLTAFLIHGLLDYFLLFHATGLLFWLLVGLWVVETRILGPRTPGPRTPGPRTLEPLASEPGTLDPRPLEPGSRTASSAVPAGGHR